MEMIKSSQTEALLKENLKDEVMAKQRLLLTEDSRGIKCFNRRVWVPNIGRSWELLLEDAHNSKYSIHPGSTKMYRDLKLHYWWPGMKLDVERYVERCMTCSQVKVEHQRPYGSLQSLEIPEWKWDKITMDFVTKLPKTLRGNDTIWVIVDRLTKSAHFLSMRETLQMDKLAKLYIDEVVSRHEVESGSRSLEKLRRQEEETGGVPSGRSCDVKGISLERLDPRKEESVIPLSEIRVDDNRCVEEPEAILERVIKKLRHKEVAMVKVQWKHHRGANVTWEAEEDLKRRYPHLFVKYGFRGRNHSQVGEDCNTRSFRNEMVPKRPGATMPQGIVAGGKVAGGGSLAGQNSEAGSWGATLSWRL
ncbi:hypothetical protein L6452_22010 [Arctium lappa]|uniref:Uncharacterized protein n=1 Tax=Arctium lappa TaxID=4217 RepID=A0ACB9AZG4_ARCLA|nr:hypothetical protein L6452_22010 [Arctium lappa]